MEEVSPLPSTKSGNAVELTDATLSWVAKHTSQDSNNGERNIHTNHHYHTWCLLLHVPTFSKQTRLSVLPLKSKPLVPPGSGRSDKRYTF